MATPPDAYTLPAVSRHRCPAWLCERLGEPYHDTAVRRLFARICAAIGPASDEPELGIFGSLGAHEDAFLLAICFPGEIALDDSVRRAAARISDDLDLDNWTQLYGFVPLVNRTVIMLTLSPRRARKTRNGPFDDKRRQLEQPSRVD